MLSCKMAAYVLRTRQRFIFPLFDKTPSYYTRCLLSWKTTTYCSYSSSSKHEEDVWKRERLLCKTQEPGSTRDMYTKDVCTEDATEGSLLFEDSLPSVKRLTKSKGPKELSYRIRQLCKDGDVDTAKESLLLEAISDVTINPTSIFNCVIYYFMKLGRFEEASELLSVMETHKFAFDEGTFSVLIQLYSRNGSLLKGIELLKKIESLEGVKLRPKMYVPLIMAAAKTGDLETAFSLYKDMKVNVVEECPIDELYECLIQNCTENGEEKWSDKVNGIFLDFRTNRVTLPSRTLSAVKDWFQSQTDIKWNAESASIDKMGRCQGCGQLLDSGQLSSAEHEMLKNHLTERLWQAVSELPKRQIKCFSSIGNYTDKFDSGMSQGFPQSLSHFIGATGPYDVVLDSLNIGYENQCFKRSQRKFSPKQVKSVVEHFLQENKRVLVVGSKPMSFEEWRKKPDKPMGSLVQFLQQHCGLFLVPDRRLDDHYSLCATVHCGPGTQLVSTDKFSDHVSCLEPNLKSLFERWQRLSQMFTVEGKQYEKQLPVDPVVQMTASSCHFPSEAEDMWLCVSRRD